MRDNPGLTEKVVEQYESMFSGVFYDRFIRGLWILAEGLVYPHFGEHCVVDEEPASGRYYISVDYGTLNPFSAGLWCVTKQGVVRTKNTITADEEPTYKKQTKSIIRHYEI